MGKADEIRARWAAATPGPWAKCDDCQCLQVWCDDHPVAQVESGEWGDSYPALRMLDGNRSVEAYIEHIPYGEIPKTVALANAIAIAHAPDDIFYLLAEIDRLSALLGGAQ